MNKTQTNPIWNFLCSVKLTIFILVLLAATSIIGTIIPQEGADSLFIKELGPVVGKIVISLELYNMYQSFWFRLIIFILSINLIACTLNKFPGTLKIYGRLPSPDREKIFSHVSPDRIIKSSIMKNDAFSIVKGLIVKQFSRTVEKQTEKAAYFYGDKGRYSLFGVYIVHLSVLLILAGSITGSLFGFKGYINILEGESIDYVSLAGQNRHNQIDLGFTVSCDKFTVDFYNNGQPKEYKSDIRFSIDGNTVKQGHLLVNHPLTFMGITFYQSSYGSVPGDEAFITVHQKGYEELIKLKIEKGKPSPLPNNGGEITLKEIRDNFMRMGPAIKVHIKSLAGEDADIWLFKNYEDIRQRFSMEFEQFPMFDPSIIEPYTFSLDGVESAYYTGLQVNKDPGVPLIYAGFFAIVLGLIMTFFTSHRRVWIRIDEESNITTISIAGYANKNPVGMGRELDRITRQLTIKLEEKNN
ncbi:MAG: cytochrome c biogenesis protein ResB [Desulfatiglans sp.]|nr:cytochrome c biogenesis protein ResB [Desulfatiglans sp.]